MGRQYKRQRTKGAAVLEQSGPATSSGDARNTIENKGNVANQALHQTIHGGVHINQNEPDLLKLLPIATEAASNSYGKRHHALCLDGTRVGVLNEIRAWADGYTEQYIYWLNGMAGTGKSTIARTIADEYCTQTRRGASFFFSRGGGDVGHAGKFFTTIARQLAQLSPALCRYICEAIAEQEEIANQTLRDQWNQLILRPLSKLDAISLHSSLVMVIDALDECEGDSDIRLLLRLLTEAKNLRSIRLRIFVTSRPETPIRLGFRAMPGFLHRGLVLHDMPRTIVDNDISVFLRDQFKEIREIFEYLPVDWPGDQTINLLVQKAGGFFIYAATVCRFIKSNDGWPPQRLLEAFLPKKERSSSQNLTHHVPSISPFTELDAIYLQILKHSMKGVGDDKDKERLAEGFKEVIGCIILLSEPLSFTALGNLLDLDQEIIHLRLHHLRSVLNVPEDHDSPIRLLHPSFRDFLLDKERCRDLLFWVEEKQLHESLARYCLRRLTSGTTRLKKDICNLQLPGILVESVDWSLVEQHLPAELQYACQYWTQHLQQSGQGCPDNGPVHLLLQQHLLHWLEALSLIRKTPEGVRAILRLDSMVNANESPALHVFIRDAKRFALYNRSIIEKAPLQIYWSALIFAPQRSLVRIQFENEMPSSIKSLVEVQHQWSSLLQTLEGHTGNVWAVAFSPDGGTVASASDDRTVRLWDAATGAALQTLEGHTNNVRAVAFSPDGGTVASASSDRTVRLWDVATGAALQTLEGHTSFTSAVAFSSDGGTVASGSDDSTVRLWDVVTGAALQTLEGHTLFVRAVAFSPDGGTVASASGDRTVRLWDVVTGAALQTLEDCLIEHLAFSREGPYLETNRGLLYIQCDSASLFAPKLQPPCTVFIRENWITQDESSILWLPSEYRPNCSAFRGNHLFLGLTSGKIIFLRFSSF